MAKCGVARASVCGDPRFGAITTGIKLVPKLPPPPPPTAAAAEAEADDDGSGGVNTVEAG